MRLRVAILDFDGTLVESVGIKDRAFEALFGGLPEWPRIRAYHLANNHVIRYEKFRHITEGILGQPYTASRETELCDRFEALVADAIVAAPEVPGASDLLTALSGASVRVYLLSMSPPDELADILERRGLADTFAGVYAHPWTKVDAIDAILRAENADSGEAVVVGDSPEDVAAAEACGVPFVGRDSGKPLPPDVPVFEDMRGVAGALLGRVKETMP